MKDLLKKFKSAKGVKLATLKELEEVVGKAKAQQIITFFGGQNQ